jgi:hypothetical protein
VTAQADRTPTMPEYAQARCGELLERARAAEADAAAWKRGVEDANRIAQRERERAEKAEAALASARENALQDAAKAVAALALTDLPGPRPALAEAVRNIRALSAAPPPAPVLRAPILWLGDATSDADAWELTRWPGVVILGGPILYLKADPPVAVPAGWWICQDNAGTFAASRAPAPEGQGT